MKHLFPDYLPEFHCTAAQCRHSCCIGWEIDIDEASLARFMNTPGEPGKKLRRCIAREECGAHFLLTKEERCPFLAKDGLCELITEFGEDFLCDICADHPRFRNFFTDRVETGLGLCCEEAARLILSRPRPPVLLTQEDGNEPEHEPPEEAALLQKRQAAFAALAEETLPFSDRLGRAAAVFGAALPAVTARQAKGLLLSMERLDPAWEKKLALLADVPETPESGPEARRLTRLAEYFFLRHMAGAAEDGRVRERAAFCALSAELLRRMTRGCSDAEFADTARMYSAEIEYSEENLEAMLDFCSFAQ